jgi:hypothetical protein
MHTYNSVSGTPFYTSSVLASANTAPLHPAASQHQTAPTTAPVANISSHVPVRRSMPATIGYRIARITPTPNFNQKLSELASSPSYGTRPLFTEALATLATRTASAGFIDLQPSSFGSQTYTFELPSRSLDMNRRSIPRLATAVFAQSGQVQRLIVGSNEPVCQVLDESSGHTTWVNQGYVSPTVPAPMQPGRSNNRGLGMAGLLGERQDSTAHSQSALISSTFPTPVERGPKYNRGPGMGVMIAEWMEAEYLSGESFSDDDLLSDDDLSMDPAKSHHVNGWMFPNGDSPNSEEAG